MKLYTQTICPKCMLTKVWINESGKNVELINLDHNEELRDELKSKGYSSLPILEVDDTLYTDIKEIQDIIEQ